MWFGKYKDTFLDSKLIKRSRKYNLRFEYMYTFMLRSIRMQSLIAIIVIIYKCFFSIYMFD